MFFSVISSQNLQKMPPAKISLSFKTMKNIEIVDPVLKMNSFYDIYDIYKKEKVKIPLRK